ncbi:MAG: T9SS C-terminal target domain-containing protein [Chitinophagia bacterium]|nr:T9SS C-terminal target domain-containing protein [Chitinophagia bacterium]
MYLYLRYSYIIKTMKYLLILVGVLFIGGNLLAQQKPEYCRATVYLDNSEHSLSRLAGLGVAVDHGTYTKGRSFTTDFSYNEVAIMQKAGYKVAITIADVSAYYRAQVAMGAGVAKTTAGSAVCPGLPPVSDPSHFHLGAYAGYFSYTEMLTIIDSMRTLYPSLISARTQIDTYRSIEGRPLYWIRISNNPTVEQPSKPQILYTAVHHAREPVSLSSTIYYLWYLLENYASDPQIKAIIDNTELYFIPCVNPDGYIYNSTTSPGGGGMWRKNRRDNRDGTYGVDLNRNYGYRWGYDNFGSSPTTSSDTYRGTGGFSEPETRAVKWLADHHHFSIALNYHTYNNDLIYPWGYVVSQKTNDSAQFDAYGEYLTQYNKYRYGTCDQTLNYITNGGSDDWMYGDSGKPKIFAFTPEIGATDFGFYTPSYNIVPDCRQNLFQNVNAAALLLPYAAVKHTHDKIIHPLTGYLNYQIQRLGFRDTAYTVTFTSLDSRLTFPSPTRGYSSMTLLQIRNDSIAYNIAATTPNATPLSYVIAVNNGLYTMRDTVTFYYAKFIYTFALNTNDFSQWLNSGWEVCNTIYHSAPSSIGSSSTPCTNYDDLSEYTISTRSPIDLSRALKAYCYYYGNWTVESMHDYVQIQAAAGSSSFAPLCGRYTKPGTAAQAAGEPLYDGPTPHWMQEEIDLQEYTGQPTNLQFMLRSDTYGNQQGFFFDDVRVVAITDTPLSIPEQTANTPAKIEVYPNPANGAIHINCAGANHYPYRVYNMCGIKAAEGTLENGVSTLNITTLPAGTYLINIPAKGNAVFVVKE